MDLLEGRVEVDDVDAFVADLAEIGDRHGVTIQAFDARYVAGRRHLERAVELADRAIDRDENVARDRAVEILLYAAGRRQIDRALEMGVDEGANRAVVLVDGGGSSEAGHSASDREKAETGAFADLRDVIEPEQTLDARDDGVLCEFFEITEAEREATDADLTDLVRERVALLEVEK